MKAIIGERPNMKPAGLGNSTTAVDLRVLEPDVQDDGRGPEGIETDDEIQQESHNYAGKIKRSASFAELDEDVKPKLGTLARPNTSKPTATGSKPKKAKGLGNIVDIAIAEEVSCQKELELDIQRSKDKASRVQAKAEVKKAAIKAKKEKEMQVSGVQPGTHWPLEV